MIAKMIGIMSLTFAAAVSVSLPSRSAAKNLNCVSAFQARLSTKAKQKRVQQFIKIGGGRELYVDYLKPAPGQPTVVLLNGLTYRTGIWDAFVKELEGNGLGILRYDPMGMGETMLKYGIPDAAIDLADQVKDLNSLLSKLRVKLPVHVAGLSYGGGLGTMFAALYPHKIATLILEAPLTGPLPAMENDIQSRIRTVRSLYPKNPATDAELYSYFLKQIVYSTYPLSEPIVLEHPYKLENVFRLTEGTVSFRAEDFVGRLPKGKVHLLMAGNDQYIPAPILEAFWNSIPTSARASRLILENSEHKIPESMPHFSAEWFKLIIAQDSRLQDGATWIGGVWAGGAKSGSTKIEIQ